MAGDIHITDDSGTTVWKGHTWDNNPGSTLMLIDRLEGLLEVQGFTHAHEDGEMQDTLHGFCDSWRKHVRTNDDDDDTPTPTTEQLDAFVAAGIPKSGPAV
jgi:hypothetical protein